MRRADRIIYAVICVGGIYIMAHSTKLGYMKAGTIGPGFFPFWIGLLLVVLSAIPLSKQLFFKKKKASEEEEDEKFASKEEIKLLIKVIGSATIAIFITRITGLLVSLGLLAGYIGKVFGAKKWSTILLLVALVPSLLYLIFDLAFGVPIPRGIF